MKNRIFCKTEDWFFHEEHMFPGWYFWDETDAYCHGPFSTNEECRDCMKAYAETL